MSAETPARSRPTRPLIEVDQLVKYFPVRKGIFGRTVGHVQAVDGISFEIGKMETFGLVGESGCGKTTAGRTLLRLIEPTSGRALYEGRDIFTMDKKSLRSLRRHMQIIFQDPYSSLNPRMTVENIVGDAMEIHGIARGEAKRERVKDLLVKVGLQASYITRYPHEFSGGQRQRIGIARALAPDPSFIVCDEAVSALDVSIQAQVINLLMALQEEFELSYLFIAHDLAVVRHLSDRVAVMYLGKIVEQAPVDDVFNHPAHPYTKALLSAIPVPDPRRKTKRIILEGDVPTPVNPPIGCRFHTRCPAAYRRCSLEAPQMVKVEPGHWAACHLYTEPQVVGLPLERQLRVVAEQMGLAPEPGEPAPVEDDRAREAVAARPKAEPAADDREVAEVARAVTPEDRAAADRDRAEAGVQRAEHKRPTEVAADREVAPRAERTDRPVEHTPMDLEAAWSALHDSLSGEWPAITGVEPLEDEDRDGRSGEWRRLTPIGGVEPVREQERAEPAREKKRAEPARERPAVTPRAGARRVHDEREEKLSGEWPRLTPVGGVEAVPDEGDDRLSGEWPRLTPVGGVEAVPDEERDATPRKRPAMTPGAGFDRVRDRGDDKRSGEWPRLTPVGGVEAVPDKDDDKLSGEWPRLTPVGGVEAVDDDEEPEDDS